MAEALLKKHEAGKGHRPTVEETLDEEDILHPPPSLDPNHHDAPTQSKIIDDVDSVEPMSAKAAGKQRATDDTTNNSQNSKNNGINLDTTSSEMFPELGAGSKPKAAVPAAWTSKKSAVPLPKKPNGASNYTNGTSAIPTSSIASSGNSTPTSGRTTPSSSHASFPQIGQPNEMRGPAVTSLPGRYTDRIIMRPQDMKPRSQMKKPVQDVLREINRRSKATIDMRTRPEGGISFEGRGPQNAVREALREIAKELGVKQSASMKVPGSVRAHIIGRQGSTIQSISQDTGAKVQLPKLAQPLLGAGDDEEDISVLIEGDALGVSLAKARIQAIVNERTANSTQRLRSVPSEFYPFIAGAHNNRSAGLEIGKDLRVQVPHYHTWTDQPPPLPSSPTEFPAFTPSVGPPIQLTGDRLAVQQARSEIERQVEELRQILTTSQLEIERGRHQFVVGERGISSFDFLAETGCAVILPPASEDTEILTVIGPQDSIENGINKVMELATSMQMTNVDIARQHPKAPKGPAAHARHLTRYMQQRREIERLERLYEAHIAVPNFDDGASSWAIYSRDGRNMMRARQEVINLINGLPPARLAHIDVEPFYHQQIRKQAENHLKKNHGVHVLFPEEVQESPEIVLVYEGLPTDGQDPELPKKAPSSAEVREFQESLQAAQQYLLDLTSQHQQITLKEMEIPRRFSDKVKRFVAKKQSDLPPDEVPVRIRRVDQSAGKTPQNADQYENIVLRGPLPSVEALAQSISEFVEQEKVDEKERDHLVSFAYPQKYANILIGKRGENINKYREEFDVDIQVNDGKVDIKGPKAKGEAAKAKILGLAKRLDDEATHILKIKPQYHRDLIGMKGGQVNRLQERYKVRVNFPRNNVQAAEDDQSIADTMSEVGSGRKNNRPQQAPDEVIIRGPRKGADEARDELLSLLQWTMDHSHTGSVSVARSQLPMLIGQGGREMENLRLTTGAQIDVPDNKRDGSESSPRADIKLKGTKKQVEDAKKLLEQRAKVFDDTITRTIEVDKKYHKGIIGGGGANIRDIVVQAGGPDDRRELARMVRFPQQGSEDQVIRVEGSKAVVDKIIESISAFVGQREGQITDTIEVPQDKHRLLIGRGGDAKRALEAKFNVSIDVPRQGLGDTAVKITGQPADNAKCKEHIMSLIREQEGETISVPRRVHHSIADNGQFFRRLRSDHKVSVDHAGQKPPEKPTSAPGAARKKDMNLPLITDDQNGTSPFSWHIVNSDDVSAELGDIPWVLRGSPEEISKARAKIVSAISQAQEQSHQGFLILPDPSTYRLVIGPGGSQINSIRKQTNTKITVPRDQARGEAIEILGDKEGVEEAKDIILTLIGEGSNGGGSRAHKR